MANALNREFNDLILTGGGAKSELWGQIISDIMGISVSLSGTVETAAFGAAILAAVGIGLYSSMEEATKNMTTTNRKYNPDAERAGHYNQLYEQVYRPLFPTTRKLIDKLAQITDSRK